MTTETEISAFIYLEADLLDRQKWNEWAALYTDDCVIWVPAWNTEEQLIKDPEISVNMMYLVGKPALEARLHRISSDDAYASLPLARTCLLAGRVSGGTPGHPPRAAPVPALPTSPCPSFTVNLLPTDSLILTSP